MTPEQHYKEAEICAEEAREAFAQGSPTAVSSFWIGLGNIHASLASVKVCD